MNNGKPQPAERFNLSPNEQREEDLRVIEALTYKLVCHAGIKKDDLPDIRQELDIELSIKRARYDEKLCAWSTFRWRILNNKITDIVRNRRTLNSTYQTYNLSMAEEIVDADGASIMEHLDQDRNVNFSGRFERKDLDRMDMTSAVDRMPGDLREVWEELLKTENQCQAARNLGISRKALLYKIGQLKKYFIKNDIKTTR